MAIDPKDEEKKRVLDAAWARFTSRMSGLRAAVLDLMRGLDARRRDKEIEETKKRLQEL